MASSMRSTGERGLSRRNVVGLLALAVVAMLAGVGIAALQDTDETPSTPTSTALPSAPPTTTASEPAAPTATETPSVEAATTHEVAPGETLSAIAARYGVTVEALVEANNLESPDRLQLGQVLRIPQAGEGGGGEGGGGGDGDGGGTEPTEAGAGQDG